MRINDQLAGPAFKQLPGTADTKKEGKLKKACQDFEALLLNQMLEVMRKSVPKNGLFSGGHAEEVFQSMQDEELAKHLAKSGGLGFADRLYAQLAGQTSDTASKERL
jgi:flagellar protein FlgJ